MDKLITKISFFLFLSWGFFCYAPATPAEEAKLTGLSVEHNKGEITVSAVLEGAFTDEIVDDIRSGIPTAFRYILKIQRRRGWWWDETVMKKEVIHLIQYSNLKQEFRITIGSNGEENKIITKDFEKAKQMMSRFETSFRLPPMKDRQSFEFYVKLKTEMKTSRMPIPFNIIFFFISWDFETSWVYSEPFQVQESYKINSKSETDSDTAPER